MRKQTFVLIVVALFIGNGNVFGQYKNIKLSTLSIDVPVSVTKGNITTLAKAGFSTYAFDRLANDSTAFNYNYEFRYGKAIYELRETVKADIWEWLENTYRPRRKRKSEFKNYKVDQFKNIQNEVLSKKLQKFQIEYIDGRRKLTLIYKLDETTQFMASVKSGDSADDFLAAQDTLIKLMQSIERDIPPIPSPTEFEQSPYIKDLVSNHLINLPFPMSIDFDNPVVEATKNNELIIAFAHADGSELFLISEDFKLKNHWHYGRIVHQIKAVDDGFFAVSSSDYNLLTYKIYPSIYLTKHSETGKVLFTQSFFKKDNVKFPGNKVFDYYSRDNVCLEIADSIGIVYTTSEERTGISDVVQKGAYRTFSTKTGFLKKGKDDYWHVSHCFAQKSVQKDADVFLFSLGDYDPRGLSVSRVDLTMHKDSTDSTSFWHEILLPLSGQLGDNYIADAHLSNPVIWKNQLFIAVETEEGAKSNHDDNPYSVNRGMNDIFIVKCDMDAIEIEVKQITKTKTVEEVNPKLAVIKNRLLLIYNEVQYNNTGLVSGIIDKYVYLNDRFRRDDKLDVLQTYYANEKREDVRMPDGPVNRDGNDLLTLPNGNVVWVRLMRNTRQLEIVEIKG